MKRIIVKGKKQICCCVILVLIALFAGSTSVYAQSAEGFTAKEQAYTAHKKVLKVAIADGWQPVAFWNSKAGEYQGLAVDLLERFGQQTGMKITYEKAGSYLDAINMTKRGTTDVTALIAGFGYERRSVKKIDVTVPYLESQMMLLHSRNQGLSGKEQYDIAEVEGYPTFTENPRMSHLYFKGPQDCVVALRADHADFMYCDIFTGMNYLRKYENRDLVSVPINVEMQFRFGLSPAVDPLLKDMLNRSIAEPERKWINDSLTHNQLVVSHSLSDFVYHYPFEIICVVIIMAFLAALICIVSLRIHNRNKIAAYGYEESYRMLADSFGEAGLSYDYMEDKMTVLGKYVGDLAMPSEIENFSDYLESSQKEISLTRQQFKDMLENGMVGASYDAEFECKMKNGEWQHFQFIFSVISTGESYQRPISMVGCLINVEKEYREKELLIRMGMYDRLTKLLNRAGAEDKINTYLQNKDAVSKDLVLIIDVDYFKQFNDSRGHQCGDDVLITVSQNLKQIFQKNDILCRWGGDEFFLYLIGAGEEVDLVEQRCNELRGKMKGYRYENESIPVTLSIGGAAVTNITDDLIEAAFQKADKALYEVKKRGRDSVYIIEE